MEEIVVGWQTASHVACRNESWLRRHVTDVRGVKGEDGVWRFSREALERVRPDDTLDTVTAAAASGADNPVDGDRNIERVSVRTGMTAPDDTEVVRIATEARKAATPAPTGVPVTHAATAVDERGIPASTFALVFAALDDKTPISKIVQEHKLLPDDVEWIAEKWRHVNEIDLNLPGVPAVIARLAKNSEAQHAQIAALGEREHQREARLVAQDARLDETVAALNSWVDTLNPQGQNVDATNGADAPPDAARPVLAEDVADLKATVDSVCESLAQLTTSVVLRRDIGDIVRRKLILLLPLALRQMFVAVPPQVDYES